MDIQEHMDGLSDTELLAATDKARTDLEKAANEQPESEWHQACFAALFLYSKECMCRGLTGRDPY